MTELTDRLPSYVTRFIGREQEIAELEARLARASLVNICGVGGLGKTRLAIEVARRFSGVEKRVLGSAHRSVGSSGPGDGDRAGNRDARSVR
jgi:MoxR-like ATPase